MGCEDGLNYTVTKGPELAGLIDLFFVVSSVNQTRGYGCYRSVSWPKFAEFWVLFWRCCPFL